MAFKSKKKNKKDDVLELTDVVEEGTEQPRSSSSDSEEFFNESDLESELNDLFGDGDTTAEDPQDSPSLEEDDDLDLDSLFQELDQANADQGESTSKSTQETGAQDQGDDQLDELLGELGLDDETEEAPEQEPEETADERVEEQLAEPLAQAQPEEAEADSPIENLEEELQPDEEPGEEPDREHAVATDTGPLEERMDELEKALSTRPEQEEIETRIESLLEARLSQQETGDSEALNRLEQRLGELEKELESRPDQEELQSRIEALLEAKLQSAEFLETLRSSLWSQMGEELDRLVETKLQALEPQGGEHEHPEQEQAIQELKNEVSQITSQSVTAESLQVMADQIKEELTEHVAKAVPSAAAEIIREEIQALSQELEDSSDS